MKTIVCINTGTTNTCVSIWKGGELLHSSRDETGVRDTAITGNKEKLVAGIRRTLDAALNTCKIEAQDVDMVMATGMISSEMGIFEVPHVKLPVDLDTLSKHLAWKNIPEIIGLPIMFVPGVKFQTEESGRDADFMRGEEIETFALIDRMGISGSCTIILPGSHCKCICVDNAGRIVQSVTMMSGELVDAITNNTILAGAVRRRFAESIHKDSIIRGAEAAKKYGITKACFQVRIMEKNGEYKRNELANFLLGAVTYYDLYAMEKLVESEYTQKIYVAGNPNVSEAYGILLKGVYGHRGEITVVPPGKMECLAAYGAILLAKKRGLC